MSDGRGIPYNHYDPDGLDPLDYYPVVWPDQTIGAGTWGYKQGVPEVNRVEDWAQGNLNWTWPYAHSSFMIMVLVRIPFSYYCQ